MLAILRVAFLTVAMVCMACFMMLLFIVYPDVRSETDKEVKVLFWVTEIFTILLSMGFAVSFCATF